MRQWQKLMHSPQQPSSKAEPLAQWCELRMTLPGTGGARWRVAIASTCPVAPVVIIVRQQKSTCGFIAARRRRTRWGTVLLGAWSTCPCKSLPVGSSFHQASCRSGYQVMHNTITAPRRTLRNCSLVPCTLAAQRRALQCRALWPPRVHWAEVTQAIQDHLTQECAQ